MNHAGPKNRPRRRFLHTLHVSPRVTRFFTDRVEGFSTPYTFLHALHVQWFVFPPRTKHKVKKKKKHSVFPELPGSSIYIIIIFSRCRFELICSVYIDSWGFKIFKGIIFNIISKYLWVRDLTLRCWSLYRVLYLFISFLWSWWDFGASLV